MGEGTSFYQVLLKKELSLRCQRNPRYSVRAFARALAMSPGALSQILSGKRLPSYKTSLKITKSLGLSPKDRHKFLHSLADRQKQSGLTRMNPVLKKLSSRRKDPAVKL